MGKPEITKYVCVGRVILTGNKQGVEYVGLVDGELVEDSVLTFSNKGSSKKPFGWVVEITDNGDGNFGGFLTVDQPMNNDPRLTEYKLRHVANTKKIEMVNLEKRAPSIRELLEDMTLGEIREYAAKNFRHRRAIKFYLMELF